MSARIPPGYYCTRERADSFYSTANFRLPTRLSSASPCSISLSLSPFALLLSRVLISLSIPRVIFKFSVSLVPSLLFRRTVRPRLSFLPVQSRFFPSRSFFSLAVCSLSLSLFHTLFPSLLVSDISLYSRSPHCLVLPFFYRLFRPVTWPSLVRLRVFPRPLVTRPVVSRSGPIDA